MFRITLQSPRIFSSFALFFLFLTPAPEASAQVTFTEVMFDPAGPESTDEFVELLNLSPGDTVDLSGWWFSDGRAVDSLRDAGGGLRLAPRQFAVILDPSYFGASSSYDGLIPEAALVLTLDNATFGSGGLSNRVGRTLILGDAGGDTVSAYTYTPDNEPGHSDEKIDPAGTNSAENWSNSRSIDGTPGAANSVTPAEFDLALGPSAPAWDPLRPRFGAGIDLEVEVVNLGLRKAESFAVEILEDSEGDSVTGLADLLFIAEGGPLAPGEVAQFTFSWDGAGAGRHPLLVKIRFAADLRPENNDQWLDLFVGFPAGALLVNEVMYRPRSGEPEWIELFNPGSSPVNLRGWMLRDANVDRLHRLCTDELLISPHDYLVVAAGLPLSDAFADLSDRVLVPADGFPTLNNSDDEIVLVDPLDYSIDSVAYTSEWGAATGVSLEKIWFERQASEPENWSLSSDSLGATPFRLNSVSPRNFDVAILATNLIFFPERPAAGDAVLLTVPVQNAGRMAIDQVEVHVLEEIESGEGPPALRPMAEGGPTGRLESEEWVNVELELGILASGWHELVIEARLPGDERPANNLARTVVAVGYPERALVINEILFEPLVGRREWVEVYNRSPMPVDLRGWQLADSTGAASLPDSPWSLEPGAYAVLAADSSIAEEYGGVVGLVVVVPNFPTLNNDRDRVEVRDMHGAPIDGVSYSGDWGGGIGISLERLHPELPSADSTSWYPSVNPLGATPGRANSVFTEVQPARTVLEVVPNPFSPDGDGVEDFAVISFQLPQSVARVNLKIFDMRGRLVRWLLNNAATAAQRQVVWDGRNERGERLPVGIYVIFLEAIRPEAGFLRTAKKTVVLARRL